jgi:hypothetical protein
MAKQVPGARVQPDPSGKPAPVAAQPAVPKPATGATAHGAQRPTKHPEPWRGFSEAWERGFREVYTVWLPRGRSSVSEIAIGRWQTWVRWLGSAYGLPLLSIVVLAASGTRSFTGDHGWLLFLLGTINGGMFAAAVLSWKYALLRAPTLDELLEPCANRESLIAVISAGLRHRYQLTLPLAFAIVPWIGLAASSSRWLHSPTGVLVLLNSTWSLALLGSVSYWLFVPPVLVIRLRACREVRLRWNDPAHTPGIRTLSEGYAYPAIFLALAAFAVTVPGVVHHPIFGRLLPFLWLWLVILALWVGVATQLSLYLIVRRFKLRVLDDLAEDGSGLMLAEHQSRGIGALVRRDQELGAVLSVYGSVTAAPGLPYGTALVVQYIAAIIGSLVAFLLQ